MNLVERLNARFNNVIHDGLALVGAVVDPWLARLERQAMNNALGRDFGLDYGDCLAAVEAEEEVHEPAPRGVLYLCDRCFAQMDQGEPRRCRLVTAGELPHHPEIDQPIQTKKRNSQCPLISTESPTLCASRKAATNPAPGKAAP